MDICIEVPQQAEISMAIEPTCNVPEYAQGLYSSLCYQRYSHICVYGCTIHYSQDMESV